MESTAKSSMPDSDDMGLIIDHDKNENNSKDSPANKEQNNGAGPSVNCQRGGYFFSSLFGALAACGLIYSLVAFNLVPWPEMADVGGTVPTNHQFKVIAQNIDNISSRLSKLEQEEVGEAAEVTQAARDNLAEMEQHFSKEISDLKHALTRLAEEMQESGAEHVAQILEQWPHIEKKLQENQEQIKAIARNIELIQENRDSFETRFALMMAAQHIRDAALYGRNFRKDYDIIASSQLAGQFAEQLALVKPYADIGFSMNGTMLDNYRALSFDMLRQLASSKRGDSWYHKIWQDLKSLVTIRKLNNNAGSEPEAVIERLETAIIAQDYDRFLQDMAQLPPALQNILQAFGQEVKAKQAAEALYRANAEHFFDGPSAKQDQQAAPANQADQAAKADQATQYQQEEQDQQEEAAVNPPEPAQPSQDSDLMVENG